MTLKQEFLSRGDADSHVRFLVLAGVYSNGGKSRVLPPRTSMSQSASCGLDPGVGPNPSRSTSIETNPVAIPPSSNLKFYSGHSTAVAWTTLTPVHSMKPATVAVERELIVG